MIIVALFQMKYVLSPGNMGTRKINSANKICCISLNFSLVLYNSVESRNPVFNHYCKSDQSITKIFLDVYGDISLISCHHVFLILYYIGSPLSFIMIWLRQWAISLIGILLHSVLSLSLYHSSTQRYLNRCPWFVFEGKQWLPRSFILTRKQSLVT